MQVADDDRHYLRVGIYRRVALVLLVLAIALGFLAGHRPGVLAYDDEQPLTFTADVAPVFQRSCVGCHRAGGIAPMSLATYDEVSPWINRIKKVLIEKHGPPWNAMPGYGEFLNKPSLSQREINIILSWAEFGAAKGDPKYLKTSSLSVNGWSLGQPDRILQQKSEFDVEPNRDTYQTFTLPVNLPRDQWLSAIDLLPGTPSVVHCATFYLQGSFPAQGTQVSGRKDVRSSAPYGSLPRRSLLGTWIPGQKVIPLPKGAARQIPVGSEIVVTIHYHGLGKHASDRSAIGLYFSKMPVHTELSELAIYPSGDFLIPAGRNPVRAQVAQLIQSDLDALAIAPIVHRYIHSLEVTAYRPDGTVQVLIWTYGTDSDWRPIYYFSQPVSLPKGTRIEVTTYVDVGGGQDRSSDFLKKPERLGLTSESLCSLFVADQVNRGNMQPTGSGHQH